MDVWFACFAIFFVIAAISNFYWLPLQNYASTAKITEHEPHETFFVKALGISCQGAAQQRALRRNQGGVHDGVFPSLKIFVSVLVNSCSRCGLIGCFHSEWIQCFPTVLHLIDIKTWLLPASTSTHLTKLRTNRGLLEGRETHRCPFYQILLLAKQGKQTALHLKYEQLSETEKARIHTTELCDGLQETATSCTIQHGRLVWNTFFLKSWLHRRVRKYPTISTFDRQTNLEGSFGKNFEKYPATEEKFTQNMICLLDMFHKLSDMWETTN